MSYDLSSYLRPSARSTLPPALIPAETYPGIIKSTEITTASTGTVMLRIQLAIDTRGPSLGWPPTIAEEAKTQRGPNGEEYPIDLEMVRLRRDFALTPAAYYRLENFLMAMGFEIKTDAEGNKNYEEAVSDLNGRTVSMEIQQFMSPRSKELINVVNEIFPRNTR